MIIKLKKTINPLNKSHNKLKDSESGIKTLEKII